MMLTVCIEPVACGASSVSAFTWMVCVPEVGFQFPGILSEASRRRLCWAQVVAYFGLCDLFAGPGGLSLGFEKVNDAKGRPVFNMLRAVEMEPWACKTLRNNFSKDCVVEGDVRTEEVKDVIEKVKEVNFEKKKSLKKSNISIDPMAVKNEIDALERKMETQVMSLSKEKELMKVIKERKKILTELGGSKDIVEKAHQISKEADDARKKADDVHREIQRKADESQKKHEQIVVVSKEIDELRKKEKELFKSADEKKGKINEIHDQLGDKLSEVSKVSVELEEKKKERKRMRARGMAVKGTRQINN